MADNRSAATARLDELMKTTTVAAKRRPSKRGWIAAGVAGCILLGVAAALVTRPPSLLAGAAEGPGSRGSLWAQLYHAKKVDTESAWQAVQTYFPNGDGHLLDLAQQGLANYYLFRTQKYDEALEPLNKLAGLGDSDPELRAYGIAGLVVAEAQLGNLEQARNESGHLDGPTRELIERRWPQLYDALERTVEDFQRH